MSREDEIIRERMKKLEELRKKKINPYPNKFDKKDDISRCLKAKVGTKVKTAGRVMTKRDMGNIVFVKLRDFSGDMQIVLQKKETPNACFDLFGYIDSGDFIGVEGKIFKTKTGQLSVLVKKLEILSKSISPLPEKWHGLQDKEERYRKRYLDLIMNPDVKEVFEKREKIINVLRNLLKKEKFLETEIPVLQPVYGGASATPFKTHLNALDIDLFLTISPELYLKRLVVGGFERVFTFARNFRNEGVDYQHNPEFSEMEYYIAYKNFEYHIWFTEELFKMLIKELKIKDKRRRRSKRTLMLLTWTFSLQFPRNFISRDWL